RSLVPLNGRGELGRLAHAFNHMMDAMADARHTLEAQVEARSHELWDFSLVDPDNRRAVDYAARHAALTEIRAMHDDAGAAACAQRLLETLHDGRIKLYLTWKMLTLRRACEALFRDGDYLPLKVQGGRAEQVCAFVRHQGNDTLLVAVPRLFGRLMGEQALAVGEPVWGDTWIELPDERMHAQWTHTLTDATIVVQAPGGGQGIALAQLFGTFPYAVLHAHDKTDG
ncbi:MAG TPA: HAMP domain-containing protein, partial [Thiobacillus sp.]